MRAPTSGRCRRCCRGSRRARGDRRPSPGRSPAAWRRIPGDVPPMAGGSAPAAHAERAEAGAAPARPRRRARMARAAVLLVVGLAAGLGLGERVWHDPPVAAADGVSVAIDGPEEVSVGETATFTADV